MWASSVVGVRVGCVVQKYGGSSVADLERISAVADRIVRTRDEGHSVVAVVSAMGNTTNELIALAKQVTPSPNPRELDMLISVGERITMALLAMALEDRGVQARSLTGSQSGIITDETHAGARVVEVRADRLKADLERYGVVIVAGFQGVSREREVTTLGRGGSDTTAVVLAAALEAEYCEICSDVDGVWSADPRIVSNAHKLDAISLDEALTYARAGAKVLYEDAVRYARDHGVEMVTSATFGPGSGSRLAAARAGEDGVKAVTVDTELVELRVTGDLATVASAVAEAGGRVRRIVGDRLHVDVRNAYTGMDVVGVDAPESIAVATAVGSRVGERPELLAVGRAALQAAGVSVRSSGGQGDQLWWQIDVEDARPATVALHEALVIGPGSCPA